MFDNIRPLKWVNPEVDGNKYDVIVIGGGAAGLVTAAGSAGVGAKVCLIEKAFLGGDCLVNGCVPSKAFLKSCQVAHSVTTARKYGVSVAEEAVAVDFAKVMSRMRAIRAGISKNDSAFRFAEKLGVEVIYGSACFEDA